MRLWSRQAPSETDPDAYATHRIYDYAGLRITINRTSTTQPIHVYGPDTTDPNWATYSRTGSDIEIVPASISNKSLPKGATPNPPNIADSIIAAITPSTGTAAPASGGTSAGTGDIRDFREGRDVDLDTIDVSKLTPVLNSYASYNGILYISDLTHGTALNESSNVDAIRLTKGGVVPTQGITIASDGAVYVQGDFNTGSTYGANNANGTLNLTSQPNSNLIADPTQYTVSSYTEKPSSIMGDAVIDPLQQLDGCERAFFDVRLGPASRRPPRSTQPFSPAWWRRHRVRPAAARTISRASWKTGAVMTSHTMAVCANYSTRSTGRARTVSRTCTLRQTAGGTSITTS